MAETKRRARPLSPHLQIYRWHVPMLTSILTRITGHALIGALVLLVWWLFAAAHSPEYFALADGLLLSWPGKILLAGAVWALWYHYLAGLRHLLFDAGRGLDLHIAVALGWGCLIGATLLTLGTIAMFWG
jgi:succinate dehydrogenase / fumarate reductase cytochrome b subunit